MKKWKWIPWAIAIVALIVLDQGAKMYFSANRDLFNEREILPGFFYLTYLENRGAAFSMLQNFRWGFVALTVVAIGVMCRFIILQKDFWARLPLALLIAGAAGNLVDRAAQGFVVDFLHFYPFGYNFPVFNVADICVCTGAGLLAVWLLFLYREPGVKDAGKT